jgi:hypothetical protein
MMIVGMEKLQQEFCCENKYACEVTKENVKVGFALETQGKIPINGLRHLPKGNTSGWYIWCGEELSSDDDFFSPLHAKHLIERCPEIVKFLGLPPGYRFLAANDYVDIWYDDSLLVNA